MLKLTKTGIGLLTKQYRSVLKKCLLLNLGLFFVAGCLNLTVIKIMKAESLYLDDMIKISNSSGEVVDKVILDGKNGYGKLYLYGTGGTNAKYADSFLSFYIYDELKTSLNAGSFKLNDSGLATGIDFAANVKAGTTDASHLATTGTVNQLLNYYYTFRNDKISEVAEFTLFLNNEKLSNVFEA